MTAGSDRARPAAEHRWEAVLRGLHARALDCLQTSVALLADEALGAGAHVVLGCRWRLGTAGRDGLTSVRRTLDDRLGDAAELLGARTAARWSGLDGPAVRRRLGETGRLYVAGDAHDLHWLPYAGQRSMAHSFLLEPGEGGFTVVDAYHNDTAWGPARPGVWTLTTGDLDRALAGGATALDLRVDAPAPAVDPVAVIAGNAARAEASGPQIDGYVEALQRQRGQDGAAERLALDVWLLGRERLLSAAWLASLAGDAGGGSAPAEPGHAEEARRIAETWQRLATASYLALRRAERGTPVDPSIVEDVGARLRDDAAFAVRLWRRHAGPGDRAAAAGERS